MKWCNNKTKPRLLFIFYVCFKYRHYHHVGFRPTQWISVFIQLNWLGIRLALSFALGCSILFVKVAHLVEIKCHWYQLYHANRPKRTVAKGLKILDSFSCAVLLLCAVKQMHVYNKIFAQPSALLSFELTCPKWEICKAGSSFFLFSVRVLPTSIIYDMLILFCISLQVRNQMILKTLATCPPSLMSRTLQHQTVFSRTNIDVCGWPKEENS